jgi:hypothetical protein
MFPLNDALQVKTVVGRPFSVSGFGNDLNAAHAAYLRHLQAFYDENKDKYGMGDRPLKIIA